ncbi:STAS domain-containing protein [Streptomyces sp. DH12]|uniref:STAS domain-containing protein n=1 Tax=Streptomyces sp. DH12 TaxID=2857010 RepID=UPI001E442E65|nr:STAS domain-containing protein [Streptomyces sp. DH12]
MADIYGSPEDKRISITRTSTDGIRVLTVRGELDHHTAPDLRRALTVTADDDPPTARSVLDLSAVTFMDSSGINVLVTAHQEAHRADGWLRLAAPSDSVMRVIELVGLDTVITCYPTLRQALRP